MAEPPKFQAPKNCLFVILDAAPYKHFSWSGRTSRPTTPFIDGLAEKGFSFHAAYSQSNVTGVSAITYHTGRYSPPRPTTPVPFERIPPGQPTLASVFKQGGFRTAFYTENPQLQALLGYGDGVDVFESYEALPKAREYVEGKAANYKRDQQSTAKLFDDLTTWIASDGSKPWFAYVHLLRPHAPYVAVDPYVSNFLESDRPWTIDELAEFEGGLWRSYFSKTGPPNEDVPLLKSLYEGGLAHADHLLSELWSRLEQAGALKDTLVVLAADHGEGFMEHGTLGHGVGVYDEDVHVPLVFWGAGLNGSSEQPAEMIDVFPTLMELFALHDDTKNRDGNSLVPVLRGDKHDGAPPVAFSMSTKRDLLAVRQGRERLICRLDEAAQIVGCELFDLSNDPEETRTLDPQSPAGKALRTYADSFLEKFRDESRSNEAFTMPEDAMDTLRALGYVD